MKLLCIPVGEDGLPKAFMVSRVATMTRLPSSKEGDRKNIFATTVVDSCPATYAAVRQNSLLRETSY